MNRLLPRAASALGLIALVALQSAWPQTLPPPPVSPAPVTNYEYDANGNPTKTTVAPGVSGFNFATSTAYDNLNRAKTTTDAKAGVAQFGYDGLDRLTRVTDARSLVTQYPRNGLGDMTQLISPDTGTANNTYDAAGNLLTRTDSRGVLASYTWDALNRLSAVTYTQSGQPGQSFSWQYDLIDIPYGQGRLGQANFPAGNQRYRYDAQGRVTGTTQTLAPATGANSTTLSHSVGYEYDSGGRLVGITYPSGRKLVIGYSGNRPSSLALAPDTGSTAMPLISQIQWQPFGPVKSWQWQMANGTQASERVYDLYGRLVRYRLGDVIRDLTYDAGDRITRYTHYDAATAAAQPSLDQDFGYDELGRLTSITTATSSWTMGYDANGNRTSVTQNATTQTYTTPSTSNRLQSISNPARSLGYDNAGNTTSDSGGYTATYDLSGRMATLTKGGVTTTYSYDNDGLRVRKAGSSGTSSTIVFVYDLGGHLLGEYDQAGNAIKEYVWFGDTPVAVFMPDPANSGNPPLVFYIHTDHLDTPRVIVDKDNNLRWRWIAEPFGNNAPENSPAELGAFTFNLRFPGQYFDQESGLFYNHHRYYDPSHGYISSDPIGLEGGSWSTYTYVDNNPLSFVDPTGLVKHTTGRWIDCGKGCRIRIDYTINESTGVVRRHLHWECKGREGTCGENGEQSHGESWDDAPEHIKQCALRHGFNGGRVPTPPAGAAGAPMPYVAGGPRDQGGNSSWNPFSPPLMYDPRFDRMVPGSGPQSPSGGPLPGPGPALAIP